MEMGEMKKAVVICDSMFGNTERIARAFAQGMAKQGIKVDCVRVDEVVIDKLVEYDFLAIGGPTHRLGISEPMKEFLEELKTIDISGKKGFCFDTRVQSRFNRFDLNSAAKRIEKRMKIVQGREGPLEEGTEKMFEQIGGEVAKLLQRR